MVSADAKFPFTVDRLARLTAEPKRRYVYDERVQGLALSITPTGAKSFYCYRWCNGKPERVRLGAFPGMTIDQARRAGAEVNASIARGQSPQQEKRQARGELSLGDLWTWWLESHAKVHKRPRSVEEDERNWARHLFDWKSRKLSDITRADVKALHAAIGKRAGPYAANRAAALLSTLFNAAITDHDFAGANPCYKLKRFPERSRERFIDAAEFPKFVAALEAEPHETLRDCIWMLLLTGQRKSTVQAMAWADVDLHAALWRAPGEFQKNGEALTVPLPPKALVILNQRQHLAAKSPYVFPGRLAGSCLQEIKGAWARILARAGMADLRLHDLRRTLGSWQVRIGSSMPVIGRSLGHKSLQATAVYSRVQIEHVRESMTAATTAMLEAASPVPRRNVVNTASKPKSGRRSR